MTNSGAIVDRQFSFGPHGTVQTAMLLVHNILQYHTEQQPLERQPGLTVYPPCASAQSITVFAVRRLRKQAVYREATVCVLIDF